MTDESTNEEPGEPPAESGEPPVVDRASSIVLPGPGAAPLTVERVADIALGAVSVAAEAAGGAIERIGASAKSLQENAPAVRDALEERGRPIREQLVSRLREAFPVKDTLNGNAASATDTPPDAAPPAVGPALVTVSAASGAAGQEIEALEQRVRELELQISVPPTEGDALPIEPPLTGAPSEETPAEAASYFAEANPVPSLAESDYSVSETEEEGGQKEEPLRHPDQGDSA